MPTRFSPFTSADSVPVHFTAPDGTFWTVKEVRDRSGDGRSLLFVSDGSFRRVRSYPSHWRALPAEELWTLSWAR